MIAVGRITGTELGSITISVPWSSEMSCMDISEQVTVELTDARKISPEQRRLAWALIGEIGDETGYLSPVERDALNHEMKRRFLRSLDRETLEQMETPFSLSDTDKTTARRYIDFLIAFCVEHGIPTKERLCDCAGDAQGYVRKCLKHKKCAVCGRPCELHHVDAVGMGRDRHDICHIGMRCLPLCREHHREAHQHGDKALMDRYHLEAVEIDQAIAEKYGLQRRQP